MKKMHLKLPRIRLPSREKAYDWLSELAMLAGFLLFGYGLYLFYVGLPILMETPQDKAIGYVIVTILVSIVVSILVGTVSGALFGSGRGGMMGWGF